MTNFDKNNWRERWLNCINELTSLDLQEKSWLERSQTNPHWSFVEFMSCYFDDLVVGDNYKYALDKELVTREEYEIIKDWHDRLDKYDSPENDDHNNEAILSDTKWFDILKLGVIAKNELAETLEEREKQILIKKIDYLNYT